MRSLGDRRAAWEAIRVARRMLAQGLVVSTAGNVSVRVPGDRFLITPTRRPYGRLRPRDIAAVSLGGDRLGGTPSREWPLHAEIYRRRADVGAILHCHSLAATAWSFTDRPLDLASEDRDYFGLGTVQISPRRPAGSAELARVGADALGDGRAALLAEHGVLAVGDTAEAALEAAIVTERQAELAFRVLVATTT